MSKSFSIVTGVFVCVFAALVLAQPVQAANPFSNFASGVKQRFQRFYLMLPGDKSGTTVLNQARSQLAEVQSFEGTMKTEVSAMDADGQQVGGGSLTLSGPIKLGETFDPKTSQQQLKMSGELGMQGTTMRASGELRVDGRMLYLKLDELPLIPYLSTPELTGKWLRWESPEKPEDEDKKSAFNSPEQQQALTTLIEKAEVSDAKKETLNGNKVFLVTMTLPDASIVEYADRMNELEEMEATQRSTAKKELSEFLDRTEPIMLELAIDRSSYYLRQVRVPFTTKLPETAGSSTAALAPMLGGGELSKISGALTVTLDKFNESVQFVIPEPSQPIEEVFGAVMGGAMMGSPEVAVPPTAKMNTFKPGEIPELTPQEEKLLKQYGLEVEGL
jgi:hypothetical protein